MGHNAQYFVDRYRMQLHPEGGWFKETYRSDEIILKEHLPNRFSDGRSFCTGIYFLLEGEQFSGFHRIKSDEMWHFYAGGPLHVYVIDEHGELEVIKLGNNPDNGEVFQAVVKAGCWFASQPAQQHSFCFVGCTVAPGFDFADFELAKASILSELYPQHNPLIQKLCRP
ncbi:MAG TPA: cupin domain-containing protein [Chitinophagales bacterium]|nr:cupin domain-containing protein [Chitinophagales bacterium]